MLKRIAMASMTSLLVGLAYDARATDGTCEQPRALDSKASELKQAFNAAASDTRLLFVVDPVCPACLQAAGKMNKAVLAPLAKDAKLTTFVVHLSVIGGKESDSKRTCKLLTDGRVVHFWDGTGNFGRSFARSAELRTKKDEFIYAWDVWALYAPGAQWAGDSPPKPMKVMHQLMSLYADDRYQFLDPDAFSAEVRTVMGGK